MESTGKIVIKKDISLDIKGKTVIIIDDIIDTGNTLNFIKKYIQNKHPRIIKTCCLLNKQVIQADYIGFECPNKFVIGYGLDYDDKYRELPDIYEVSQI